MSPSLGRLESVRHQADAYEHRKPRCDGETAYLKGEAGAVVAECKRQHQAPECNEAKGHGTEDRHARWKVPRRQPERRNRSWLAVWSATKLYSEHCREAEYGQRQRRKECRIRSTPRLPRDQVSPQGTEGKPEHIEDAHLSLSTLRPETLAPWANRRYWPYAGFGYRRSLGGAAKCGR